MLFTTPAFLVFMAIVFALAWLDHSNRRRKLYLLAASYVFYAGWDWRFCSLIALSTAVDYGVGLALGQTADARRRRLWLSVSLVANLGILGFFKYFDFFLESADALLAALGIPGGDRALGIVLPVGISFYTFQSISYSFDVYRRRIQPTRDPVDFALYVSFFPQLVAGPIVRARTFLPQLARSPELATVDFRASFALFLQGFVKKRCIADNLAPVIDGVFADPSLHSTGAVWIAVPLYAIQLYCDFSGYTDMAIACARLLGYELTPNFRFPYLSRDINEFWRRWHISLATWLRDYVYIPLGGLRGSHVAADRSLLITMILCGLWHGAAWTFVVWGTLQGVAMVVHRAWQRLGPRPSGNAWATAGATAVTFYFFCATLILFRAESSGDAWILAQSFVALRTGGSQGLDPILLLWPALLLPIHWLASRGVAERAIRSLPPWGFAVGHGAAWALALAFVPMRSDPFIYFQF